MFNKFKEITYRFLRVSEKYTKTDMVYLARGGFWLTIERAVSMAVSFVSAVAFANLIPSETYGIYKYVLSLAGIFTLATLSGVDTALTRSVARGYEGSLKPGLKLKIKFGLLGGLAGLIAAGYYYFQDNHTLAAGLIIAAAFAPFMDSFLLITSLLLGRKNFESYIKYNIFLRIFTALAIIASLIFAKNVLFIILAYFAANTLLRLLVHVLIIRKHQPNDKIDPAANSYGKHLSLMKGLSVASSNVNNIFLFHFIGSQGLAVFSFIIAPIEQLRSLIRIIENILLPKLSGDEWHIPDFKQFIKKIAPFLGAIGIVIFVYILFAPLVYKLFFPQYISAVFWSQVYSISLVFTTINMLLTNIQKAKKKVRQQYYMSLLEITLNFIITLPMIYFYGLAGLVLSIVAIKILEMISLSFLVFQDKKPFNPEKPA